MAYKHPYLSKNTLAIYQLAYDVHTIKNKIVFAQSRWHTESGAGRKPGYVIIWQRRHLSNFLSPPKGLLDSSACRPIFPKLLFKKIFLPHFKSGNQCQATCIHTWAGSILKCPLLSSVQNHIWLILSTTYFFVKDYDPPISQSVCS